jgi:DNA-binding NtrC family response regulator
MCLIENYNWPGNVRELRNIVERLAILCDQERIEPHHLPAEIRQTVVRSAAGMSLPRTWEEFKRLKQQVRDSAVQQLERQFLLDVLQRCEGNVSHAADEIGIQRTNLHALMRKHGLGAEG